MQDTDNITQDPAIRVYSAIQSEYSRIAADKSKPMESHSDMVTRAVRAIAEKPEFAELQNQPLRHRIIEWVQAGIEISEIFARVSDVRSKSNQE